MTVLIRRIDYDQCSREEGEPPLWAKITARVNGVDVQFALDDEQAAALRLTAESVAKQQLAKIRTAVLVEVPKESA